MKAFKAAIDEACNKFHWGTIIQAVLIERDNAGNILETASLFTNPAQVTLNLITDNA